jgi:hypothetical protein
LVPTIRLHGEPVTEQDAAHLARWLRATWDPSGTCDRLDRMVDAGTGGMLAISRSEATAILTAIAAIEREDTELAERLGNVAADLVAYVETEAA